jgi:hypothetical protein
VNLCTTDHLVDPSVRLSIYTYVGTRILLARTASNVSRWILVAGTGRIDLPPEVNWAARAVGAATAAAGFGLVVGGWEGVDYVTAEAFATGMTHSRIPLLTD